MHYTVSQIAQALGLELCGDGSIEVTGATGIVFVLLPGGTFWMAGGSTMLP